MRSELEHTVFGLLFLVSNRLQTEGDRLTKELTLRQWLLLLLLIRRGEEARSISDAARLFGTTRQNTRKLLGLLEKKGFVRIEESKQDARALNIAVTPRACTFFEANKQLGSGLLETVFEGVDDSALETLAVALGRMRGNLEEAGQ